MPSRDPKTGRRLSGAAQRKKARPAPAPAPVPSPHPSRKRPIEPPPPPPPAPAAPPARVSEAPSAEQDGNPFAGLRAPPLDEGPPAIESWGAEVGAMAVEAAQRGQDPGRVRWVHRAVRKIGQLKDKSRHSWKMCQALAEFRGEEVDLRAEERPAVAVALPAWAYFRIAVAIHAAATAPAWDEAAEAHWSLIVEAAASIGYCPQVQQLRDLKDRLLEEAGASNRH